MSLHFSHKSTEDDNCAYLCQIEFLELYHTCKRTQLIVGAEQMLNKCKLLFLGSLNGNS